MATIIEKGGFMSVRDPTPESVFKESVEKATGTTFTPRKKRRSGRTSTRESPTPSAGSLTGTAEQREQQIQEFRQRQQAGTLVGQQTQTQTGGVVEPARTTEQQIQEALKPAQRQTRFSLDLLRKAGRQFFFVEGTPIEAARTLASPFQSLLPQRRGEVKKTPIEFFTGGVVKPSTVQTVATGLFNPNLLISEQDVLERELRKTPEALIPLEARAEQIASEIKQELTPSLQERVTRGELTVAQAEAKFQEQFQPRFQERTTQEFKETAKLKGAVERSLQPSVDVGQVAEIGATFALSTTPAGTAILGGSLLARGTERAATADTTLGRTLGVAEAGAGLVIGSSSVILAERIADQALVKELLSQRGRVTGREVFRQGDQSLFRISSERTLGSSGSLKTEILAPTFRTGKNTFSVTGGRGISKLDVFSVETGGRRVFIEGFTFGGRQTIQAAAPRIVSSGAKITLPELQSTTGTGFVQRVGEKTFREFGFGGASQIVDTPVGQIVKIDAGRVGGLRVGSFGSVGVKVPIQESGAIRLLSQDVGEGFGGLRSTGTGLQTSLKQTFGGGGIATGIEKTLFKPTTPSGLTGGVFAQGTISLTEIKPQRQGGFVQQSSLDLQLDKGIETTRTSTPQIAIPSPRGRTKERTQLISKVIQTPAVKQQQRQGLIPKLQQVQTQAFSPRGAFIPIIPTPVSPIVGFDLGFGFPSPGIPSLGPGGQRIRKRPGKRKKRKVAPGFTGIVVGGIGLPKPGQFGISPFQLRGLPSI